MNESIPILPSRELTTISRIKDCAIHMHKNCEFLMILDGTIINTINDYSITAKPGDMFFINNKVTHSLKQTEPRYEHRDIYISSQHIKELCEKYFDDAFYDYLMSTDKIIQIHLSHELFMSFALRLKKNQTLSALYPEKRAFLKKSIVNIIISLLGLLYEQTPEYPSFEKKWLYDFLEKIQAPSYFSLPIDDIVALSGYSHTYFSHIFTQTFNMSFKSYVTLLKVNYAKTLLSSPEIPISEISYICGFSSQSHFTQVFKNITETTPLLYRRQQLENQQ